MARHPRSAASPPRNRRVGELREYSTQLLSDLENVYNGDVVAAGHKGEKLQRRLQQRPATQELRRAEERSS